VLRHPAAEPPTRARAQNLIRRLRHVTAQTSVDKAIVDDLEATAAAVLARLQLPLAPMQSKGKPAIPHVQGLIDALSERELEILALLAAGFTNQQIAEKLTIVLGTVKAHNHTIFRKLDVANRVQAITRARELSLI
jgi:ATP/maltotriose-dependent transcriptional regulator MalT